MKLNCSRQREAGLTLFEVGVLVVIVAIMAVLLLPNLARSRINTTRNTCINNLKQVGLAFRIWEGDNNDMYPMGLSMTTNGSMEMVTTGDVIRTFQVMSNELYSPKILVCPADPARKMAADFVPLYNYNVSYMVGVDTTNDAPMAMVLSGDCNFELGGKWVGSGLQSFGAHNPLAWSASRHVRSGNIGFADGSVMQLNDVTLTNHLAITGMATNRFAIP